MYVLKSQVKDRRYVQSAGTIGRDFLELFCFPLLTLSPSAVLRAGSETLYSPQTGISTSALSFFSPKTFKAAV